MVFLQFYYLFLSCFIHICPYSEPSPHPKFFSFALALAVHFFQLIQIFMGIHRICKRRRQCSRSCLFGKVLLFNGHIIILFFFCIMSIVSSCYNIRAFATNVRAKQNTEKTTNFHKMYTCSF